MRQRRLRRLFWQSASALCLGWLLLGSQQAYAVTALPTPAPKSGSYGLEAVKKQPPPTKGATITVPGSGGSFSTSPTKVSGICPDGLLVQVYNNGVLAGSTICKGGSFSVDVTLYNGQNDLTASVFDDLDQAGPASNTITVSYNNTSFAAFGVLMTLSSNYGRRAADPNSELVWPLILTGGSGPYAFSIDWGDGGAAELKSQGSPGEVRISHVYKKAGTYTVIVKVTDAAGATAFLQLTAVANGKVTAESQDVENVKTVVVNKVMWIPLIIAFVLLFPAFWLGRRSELVSLHKRMQKTAETYKEL